MFEGLGGTSEDCRKRELGDIGDDKSGFDNGEFKTHGSGLGDRTDGSKDSAGLGCFGGRLGMIDGGPERSGAFNKVRGTGEAEQEEDQEGGDERGFAVSASSWCGLGVRHGQLGLVLGGDRLCHHRGHRLDELHERAPARLAWRWNDTARPGRKPKWRGSLMVRSLLSAHEECSATQLTSFRAIPRRSKRVELTVSRAPRGGACHVMAGMRGVTDVANPEGGLPTAGKFPGW